MTNLWQIFLLSICLRNSIKKERERQDVRSNCNLFQFITNLFVSRPNSDRSRIDLDLRKIFIRDTDRNNGVAITLKEEKWMKERGKKNRRKKIIETYTRIPRSTNCVQIPLMEIAGSKDMGVSIDRAEIQDIYVHNDAPYCKFVTLYHC